MPHHIYDISMDLESLKDLRKQKPAIRSKNSAAALGLNTTLDPYTPDESSPWNRRRAAHLLRRMQFGASQQMISHILNGDPSAIVDQNILLARELNLPQPPEWWNTPPPVQGSPQSEFQAFFQMNQQWYLEYQREWLYEMQRNPLREKMALFWHDHFATEISNYQLAAFTVRHLQLLRSHALGNFKTLVREIGLDQAMLIYLNGVQNRVGDPNENFARELLELFTMGLGHYSQDDISEIARALTGYNVNYYTFETGFNPNRHDSGEKTFFGRTGNFGYNDVINIIFEERAEEIAEFVCSKIYSFFCYEYPNPQIITGMKQVFLDSGFEIAPVIEILLKSEHFYDDEIIGAKIKSPVEFLISMYQETQEPAKGEVRMLEPNFLFVLEQFLFNPPNVAGWPEYRSWLDTSTLQFRWFISQYNLFYVSPEYQVDFIAIAQKTSDPNDPYQLVAELADYMLSVPLPESEFEKLPEVLLQGTPDYEWNINNDGAAVRILNLMNHIRQLPEYQLT
ncbi:DUF1800 domain-containing protein [Balneola sp. MJW-20]|uniref:DUF1800 domain-containing protein n=1 Tax=Gracilimonas aurantiaca TaxID=3234185 RepID=UPI0034674940